jgi:hypothetical protein
MKSPTSASEMCGANSIELLSTTDKIRLSFSQDTAPQSGAAALADH